MVKKNTSEYLKCYNYIGGIKQSLVAAKTLRKTEIQGTIQHGRENGDPMHEGVSYTGYLAHQNHSKIVRNMEERNVGTIRGGKSQTRPSNRALRGT